jgi:hypothetical protein
MDYGYISYALKDADAGVRLAQQVANLAEYEITLVISNYYDKF